MTRDEMITATVTSIMIHARLAELRELARATTQTYRELIAHGVPADMALHFFACSRLRERLDEERSRR
jgi:hypothetical protein